MPKLPLSQSLDFQVKSRLSSYVSKAEVLTHGGLRTDLDASCNSWCRYMSYVDEVCYGVRERAWDGIANQRGIGLSVR